MCDTRPEVIKQTKSLWTGIRIEDDIIKNQNGVILGGSREICPLCQDCSWDCKKCWVTEVFVGRWHFKNMNREKYPCNILTRRIRKSKNPQGLLFSYLAQIETAISKVQHDNENL